MNDKTLKNKMWQHSNKVWFASLLPNIFLLLWQFSLHLSLFNGIFKTFGDTCITQLCFYCSICSLFLLLYTIKILKKAYKTHKLNINEMEMLATMGNERKPTWELQNHKKKSLKTWQTFLFFVDNFGIVGYKGHLIITISFNYI